MLSQRHCGFVDSTGNPKLILVKWQQGLTARLQTTNQTIVMVVSFPFLFVLISISCCLGHNGSCHGLDDIGALSELHPKGPRRSLHPAAQVLWPLLDLDLGAWRWWSVTWMLPAPKGGRPLHKVKRMQPTLQIKAKLQMFGLPTAKVWGIRFQLHQEILLITWEAGCPHVAGMTCLMSWFQQPGSLLQRS